MKTKRPKKQPSRVGKTENLLKDLKIRNKMGRVILLSDEQPAKARNSMDSTDDGMSILSIAMQWSKALIPIFLTDGSNFIFVVTRGACSYVFPL